MKILTTNSQLSLNIENSGAVKSGALQWATKYLHNLDIGSSYELKEYTFNKIVSPTLLKNIAQKLKASFATIGLQVWTRALLLLAKEIKSHPIDSALISPEKAASDATKISHKS